MIKINLLGVPTAVGPKPVGPPPTTARMVITFVGALLVSFVVVLVPYKIWSTQVAELEQKLKHERDRETELKEAKRLNDRYKQQIDQLNGRLNTIKTLQNSRTGPVEFMTSLAALVNRTNDLYLLSVTPSGNRMAIRGQSNSVESIATFIAALKQHGGYEEVQLRQYFEDDQNNRLAFKFNLDFVYKGPTPPTQAPPPAGQPAATQGAPPRPGGM